MTTSHTEAEPDGGGSDATDVVVCAQLWAHEGRTDELTTYEDQVLALLPDHGARVVVRAQNAGTEGAPTEVQVLEFPTAGSLDRFMNDGRRTRLAPLRDAAISRTDLWLVELR